MKIHLLFMHCTVLCLHACASPGAPAGPGLGPAPRASCGGPLEASERGADPRTHPSKLGAPPSPVPEPSIAAVCAGVERCRRAAVGPIVETEADDTPVRTVSEAIAQRLVDSGRAAEVARLLSSFDDLLRLLPLDRLESVALEPSELVLTFEHGQQAYSTRSLETRRYWALNSRGAAELRRVEAQAIRVGREVRIQRGPDGITGLRRGDLQVKWGIFWLDLTVAIERTEVKIACDTEGRVLLEVDEHGSPRTSDSGYLPLRTNRWVVISAMGRRIELPIAADPAPRREPRLAAGR